MSKYRHPPRLKYNFLIDTYATERVKVVSVWSMFRDDELPVRPSPPSNPPALTGLDARGRSVHEQLVHQCVSEDFWFRTILGIDVQAPPLPLRETRWEFMARYAEDTAKRLAVLRTAPEPWWEEVVSFFNVRRSRAWVMTRRMTHTAQHRGQLLAMLRMLGHDLHSTYGPTADTGGLMQNHAPTIYAYATLEAMLEAERNSETKDGAKSALPPRSDHPVTERPSEGNK
jgi:uncharacterized damage-inducible protein DinB